MRVASTSCLTGLLLGLLCLLLGGGEALAKDPKKGKPGEPGVPDKALQKRIDKAIDQGADWLRKQQKASGMIGAVSVHGSSHYRIGTTALAGLALLAAGDKPDLKKGGGAVDRALAYCMKADKERGGGGSRSTYDTGTLLMFATKYYRQTGAKKKGSRYARGKKGPCNLPAPAKAWIRDMAMWLVKQQKPTGGWGYPHDREDWSNTQYALLGLRAARDCGVPISPAVFMKAIRRALELQQQDGPKVMRVIPAPGPGGTRYVVDQGDRARGWGYLPQNPVFATGSMTTSGIAILAISHTALTSPKRFPPYDVKLENKVREAIQDGFAWLDKNFAVDRNPPAGAPAWHYYYLYGLERACVFGGRTLLGEHDWYIRGAEYLVDKQQADGKWSTGALGAKEIEPSDVVDTAWAVLFLARSTRPAPPIEAPVVTGD